MGGTPASLRHEAFCIWETRRYPSRRRFAFRGGAALQPDPDTDWRPSAKDNLRFKCNQHKIKGMQVNYKSAEKYVGDDDFELLVLLPAGFAWEVAARRSVGSGWKRCERPGNGSGMSASSLSIAVGKTVIDDFASPNYSAELPPNPRRGCASECVKRAEVGWPPVNAIGLIDPVAQRQLWPQQRRNSGHRGRSEKCQSTKSLRDSPLRG